MFTKIGQYIRSLVPSFSRNRIEEDLDALLKDINENTLPSFDAATEHFSRDKFSSKETLDFEKAFSRGVKLDGSYKGNFIMVLNEVSKNTLQTIAYVKANLEKHFTEDVNATGMTYTRANVLRYIEVLGFYNRYARKLLLWVYDNEAIAHKASSVLGKAFTKAEMDWLTKNRTAFFAAVRIVSIKQRELEGAFKNIPNMIVVPEEEDVVIETVGAAKVDPLRMGILPTKVNFIYHIRMSVAEYQVARYHAGVEEAKMLELRLLDLKKRSSGEVDAKLEQLIEYTENRLKKLNAKLAKMEEE